MTTIHINKSVFNASLPHESPKEKGFILAHLSDLHMSCTDHIRLRDLMNKRILGYIRWKLFRRSRHYYKIPAILSQDLQLTRPDHIIITGDQTHLGLPCEFLKTREWLQTIGAPARVSVIPGNHDCYVKSPWDETFIYWLDYMSSDPEYQPGTSPKNLDTLFPTLRIRGNVALIGVCTARPSALHLATGYIGSVQLKKLEVILRQTADQRLFRVIFMHHPPITGVVKDRRALTDISAFQALIADCGCELILHGHAHRVMFNTISTPSGLVPVIGAPSVSSLDRAPGRLARYYLYKISSGPRGWNIEVKERLFQPDIEGFIDVQNFHAKKVG